MMFRLRCVRVPALLLAAGSALAQQVEAPAEKAQPVFADGQAQVVEAFKKQSDWIKHFLWVEAPFDSDGDGKKDRLHVDVIRQKQTDTEGLKVPVVYETSPYFAGVGPETPYWDPKHELGEQPPKRKDAPAIGYGKKAGMVTRMESQEMQGWVARGFAVVHSSSPGTGFSDGCPTVGGENESLAPKAVIDWLCGRAKGFTTRDGNEEVKATWCTGKVGMTGTSYNGTLPLAAATTGVEGLEAIIPIAPNTSYYAYYRSNGLIRHPGGYMGEDMDVLYDFINSGNPERRDWCDKHVREGELKKSFDRLSGDWNDFWAGRDYLQKLGPMKAATLMAHAFNDWNVMPEHSVRIYEALKKKGVPCMAYFHQGAHGGPPPLELRVKWFTRFLYGVDNGIDKGGPRSWIVREGERTPTPYADYPNPEAAPVTLYPVAGGNEVGALDVAAKKGQKPETLVDDATISGAKLAQAEKSDNRLLFVTPELTQPLHLSGTAKVAIRVASSKPAVNLSVWIVQLPWKAGRNEKSDNSNNNDNIVTRGWADPQNHKSPTKGEPLKPGEFVTLTFDLQPDDQIVPAGRRLGFMIFASDFDYTLHPAAGTKLTVDLDATSLALPVVGGSAAFAKATGAPK